MRLRRRGTHSLSTQRWSKRDSNPRSPLALCKFFAAGAGGTSWRAESTPPFSRDRRALVKLKRLPMVAKVPLVFAKTARPPLRSARRPRANSCMRNCARTSRRERRSAKCRIANGDETNPHSRFSWAWLFWDAGEPGSLWRAGMLYPGSCILLRNIAAQRWQPRLHGDGPPFSYRPACNLARGVRNRVISWRGASTTGGTHARLRLHHHRCGLSRLRAR
jgi:hypothetical protein